MTAQTDRETENQGNRDKNVVSLSLRSIACKTLYIKSMQRFLFLNCGSNAAETKRDQVKIYQSVCAEFGGLEKRKHNLHRI